MPQQATDKTRSYRNASEALHRDTAAQDRHGANMRMLWQCGWADLIRADFYGLFAFPADAQGQLLDAGCGTGFETRNIARLAPGLRLHGVDISSVLLAAAVSDRANAGVGFHQAALEHLPFPSDSFDYIGSHEVIEHVEEPTEVLPELFRVLKPGGICAIATPNGASLWVEHLRQRLARLIGRRGAPVGEDHVRPPSFWRHAFKRTGFVIERQIFDGAAFEFLTYVAPASWMRPASRLLEPLRVVPLVNGLLCDRVKYRLRKPGVPTPRGEERELLACPLCHAPLAPQNGGTKCRNGHAFGRNAVGLIDFTALLEGAGDGAIAAPAAGTRWTLQRRLRRLALAAACLVYVAWLALLLPFGWLIGRFHQPFRSRAAAS